MSETSYDYEMPFGKTETEYKTGDSSTSQVYGIFMALASIGIVMRIFWLDDAVETCPDALTFWTEYNFWLHVCVFAICAMANVWLKYSRFGERFMLFDVAFLASNGFIAGLIGAIQTGVALYKSIGKDCETNVDLAVWQIVLLAIAMTLVTLRSETAQRIIKRSVV